MISKYTAQEMRDMAEQILHTDDDWYEDAGYMLIQAADEVERLRVENAQFKSDILELLKCLQKIYDEECTGFGTGDVFNRISKKMNGGAE